MRGLLCQNECMNAVEILPGIACILLVCFVARCVILHADIQTQILEGRQRLEKRIDELCLLDPERLKAERELDEFVYG